MIIFVLVLPGFILANESKQAITTSVSIRPSKQNGSKRLSGVKKHSTFKRLLGSDGISIISPFGC